MPGRASRAVCATRTPLHLPRGHAARTNRPSVHCRAVRGAAPLKRRPATIGQCRDRPTHRARRRSERQACRCPPRASDSPCRSTAPCPRASDGRGAIGVAAALLLLVGGSIAFAGQALDGKRTANRPASSSPPPPAPALLAPGCPHPRANHRSDALRPTGLRVDQHTGCASSSTASRYGERPLPRGEQFVLGRAPARGGRQRAFAPRSSAPVARARARPGIDRRATTCAPLIHVAQPQPDATVYTARRSLRGRTEAGADMRIVDVLTGRAAGPRFEPDGRFEAALVLVARREPAAVASQDPAGNVGRIRIVHRAR